MMDKKLFSLSHPIPQNLTSNPCFYPTPSLSNFHGTGMTSLRGLYVTPALPSHHPLVMMGCVRGAQEGSTSLNPSEDVFGLDHRAHRSLADSHSDTSYFISGFGVLPPHSAVINTSMGMAHIFLTFSALTLFNRVT